MQSIAGAGDKDYRQTVIPGEGKAGEAEERVTTTPRKRIVLEVDRQTGKIGATISMRNRTGENLAFRCQCSRKTGYIIDPKQGVVKPGDTTLISVHLQDNCWLDWEMEKDKFIIGIASSNRGHPSDYIFQEKKLLCTAVSPTAKERITLLNQEKHLKLKQDEADRLYQRNINWLICTVVTLGFALFAYVDFCPLTPIP
jgi:hypothetical protein